MFWNAKNGTVKIENTDMEYVSFGCGTTNLVMIPGIGDGLKTVKGTAAIMSILFKNYGKNHRVHIFSRKTDMTENDSISDMADDQRKAMQKMGITKAHIMGISQGGMIAQRLAINYPDIVDKLILVVTAARSNETIRQVIGDWITLAEANDYKRLFIDTIEKSYTEKRKKGYRLFYPLLTKISKPKSFARFIIQANAILQHDAYDELQKIQSPSFIIGAGKDKIVGANASPEIAEKIPDSKLLIYEELGHGAYEEAKDFEKQILDFLKA